MTVTDQPTTPWQTCAVTNGTGMIVDADVATVAVACTTNSYKIRGTVSGLTGTGLALEQRRRRSRGPRGRNVRVRDRAGERRRLRGHRGRPADDALADLQRRQRMGGVAGGDVSNVMVTCAINDYAVGGTVSGLAGTVVLQNNAGDSLILTANGNFAFPTHVTSGGLYQVTCRTSRPSRIRPARSAWAPGRLDERRHQRRERHVRDQQVHDRRHDHRPRRQQFRPPEQRRRRSGPRADRQLHLRDGDPQRHELRRDDQDAAVGPDPDVQRRRRHGDGRQRERHDGDDELQHELYLIGGTVTGLIGSGVVLQNNGGGDIALAGSGTFTFAAPVSSGAMYKVTVKTQPTEPWQTCTGAANAAGTVTNSNVSVAITCASNPYPISVMVSNVAGGGLVLQNNAGDNQRPVERHVHVRDARPKRAHLRGDGAVAAGEPVADVLGDRAGGNGAGGPVALVASCVTNTYRVGGTVSGLTGTGLVLRDNGGDDRSINADGSFTFTTPVASGAAYNVTVATQPSSPAQSCVVSNGMGTISAGPVSGVTIACANVATCATVDEGQPLTLTCPAGRKILSIDFASYGTPAGMCGVTGRDLQRDEQRVDRRRGLHRPELVYGQRDGRGVRRSMRRYVQAPLGAGELP